MVVSDKDPMTLPCMSSAGSASVPMSGDARSVAAEQLLILFDHTFVVFADQALAVSYKFGKVCGWIG